MKDCSDVGKSVIRTVERTAVVCPGRAGSGQFRDTSRDAATVMCCNRLRITQFASCHDKDARPGATTDLHHTMQSLPSALIHRLFSIATSLLLFLLALGPIPNHVAFVMDGNRRYARELGQQVENGHAEGFNALRRVSCRYPQLRTY